LRVAQLILSRHFGGAERHVLDLSQQLLQRGVQVQLIGRSGGWLDRQTAQQTKLDSRLRIDLLPPLLRGWALRRLLDDFQPDLIHSHLGKAARLSASLGQGLPRIASLHGQYKHKDYARQQALICVAPWQRQGIAPDYPGRVALIPHFLPHELPETLGESVADRQASARLRDQLGIPADALVIGSVGRFSSEKGMDILIQAFRLAALDNARLLLLGDGAELSRLRAMAPPGVVFAGWVAEPLPYYALFDVYVSGARAESFGLALLQAMQLGLPVLASRAPGPEWLLAEGGGLLVPLENPQALADGLRQLAASAGLRQRLGGQAAITAGRFSPAQVVPQLMGLYRELMA
jgi:glycosyltransferase involved in cell wall biosynthesis